MKKRRFIVLIVQILLLAGLLALGVRWLNSRAQPAVSLGLQQGRLAPCPDRPNCIASQADDPQQQAPPIPFSQPASEALRRLERVVRALPRSRVVKAEDGYLHAEFRSRLAGFVDDVEFAFDDDAQLIHFRSASRVGYSDLGVNRERIEEIRQRYAAP